MIALWRQLVHGLRRLVGWRRAELDTADEVRHYLDEATAAHVAAGLSAADARRAARIEVGSQTAVRDQVRFSGWEQGIATVGADLKYSLRMLGRSPAFSVIAVVVIALGSGAVTTIFSGLNAIVLRPLPGTSEPDRLISIDRRRPDADDGIQSSYAYYDFLGRNARGLDGVAAWTKASFSISAGGEGMAVYGNLVSANYFEVLGIRPALGRFFEPAEGSTPLAHPVIVVSHGFWRTRLGADSALIGRPISVNGSPYTLIGVAPAVFHGVFTPLRVDAWAPLMMQAHLRPGRDLQHSIWLWTFGRMKPGITRGAAETELSAATARYIADGAEPSNRAVYTRIRITGMTGLPADATAMAIGFIGILLGAALLVLFIGSVNVASMLSARAIARRREMAVRAALGAGRGRLMRQLLTEILVLFALGGTAGLLLAWFATSALERLTIPSPDLALMLEISPDGRVFAFALATSLITGLIFGLGPALRAARNDINTTIRQGGDGGRPRRVMGNALIVGQLALSLVLLVAAGLFLRALDRGIRTNPGFDSSGVAVATFNTESFGYDPVRGRAFYQALDDRLLAMPGVTSATFSNITPLTFSSSGARIRLDGPDAGDAETGSPIQLSLVSAKFFDVLKIPLASGRPIDGADRGTTPPVAVVNETFARRFWPDGSALGRTFTHQDKKITIVGVARDAKYGSLSEVTPAFAYFPLEQNWQSNQALMVRTTRAADDMAVAIQEAVLSIDPKLPRPVVTTLKEATGIVLLPQRIAAIVTGVLGGVGLLLAAVGLYGIIAYGVGRRTREIGLRMALGADRGSVLRLVVRDGLRLAVVGVVAGLILAAAAMRLLSGFLFGISSFDVPTFAAMSGLFVGAAFLASYLPARRAAAADPMAALRVD